MSWVTGLRRALISMAVGRWGVNRFSTSGVGTGGDPTLLVPGASAYDSRLHQGPQDLFLGDVESRLVGNF
jgi:hypothetical protein